MFGQSVKTRFDSEYSMVILPDEQRSKSKPVAAHMERCELRQSVHFLQPFFMLLRDPNTLFVCTAMDSMDQLEGILRRLTLYAPHIGCRLV